MKIPQRPPSLDDLFAEPLDGDGFRRIFEHSQPLDAKGRYLHWDEMRNRRPPEGLDVRAWWFATSVARRSLRRILPFRSVDGTPFTFCNVDTIQKMVHRIDQQAGGQILADDVSTSLRSSNRYLVSSLIEEAITSSQLEGASTTRRVAKELLTSGRKPRDRSETMIANNYAAMLFSHEISGDELTTDAIFELHRILTQDTLDNPDSAGRTQRPEESRVSVYWNDDTLLHTPPKAGELPARLEALCRFANSADEDGYIHPVVKAIIIHFCLAYDHPFEDGNGRTTRALFYRSMLHDGYWLAQYISISSILRKAPVKYAMSYLYTETDSNDMTYFIIYQLGVIERAIKSLHDYLTRKIVETREVEKKLQSSSILNHRQMTVVEKSLRDPGESFTIASQQTRHRVTYQTARSDLLELEDLGLMQKSRVSNKFVFRPVPEIAERLKDLGSN
jgi:Fic family protein